MNDGYLTDNWKDFCDQDRKIAIELLTQMKKIESEIYGKPTIYMNLHSGYVFLSDEDYNTYMLNDLNEIEKWFSCVNCGNEGFESEIIHNDGYCENCQPELFEEEDEEDE
jgi:hypothetical protein